MSCCGEPPDMSPSAPLDGRQWVLRLAVLIAAAAGTTLSHGADQPKDVRLYALDCGRAELQDMAGFSDTGDYDGQPGAVAVPCFLIRHPKGTLLWDTGLGDKLAENKAGVDAGGIHMTVSVTLVDQLKTLGLTPDDVAYVAFSHFHFDHTGNANLFGSATWIINKAELAWASGSPAGVEPSSFSAYKTAKTRMIDGDDDVFGDGAVRILRTPGHTPGHQALEIRLKSGTVMLSGDLYHLRDNRVHRRVSTYGVDRADTLASMDRLEKIIANRHARLIIQHDPLDFQALPQIPTYLE